MGMPWGEIAASAYRAYAASTGNKNFRGEPMPTFGQLPEPIRIAWEAAVRHTGTCLTLGDTSFLPELEQQWQGWLPPGKTLEIATPSEGLEHSLLATTSPFFGFGSALEMLKRGHRVARSGWNGKGMYLFLIGVDGNSRWTYTNGQNDNLPLLPFLAMKTADNHVVPWLASQTDMLSNDWELHEVNTVGG